MKTVSDDEAEHDLKRLLDSAQQERVVITRNGKPSAILLGLETYDEEDLQWASSPDFWTMIQRRRREGSSISLAEAKARLKARES